MRREQEGVRGDRRAKLEGMRGQRSREGGDGRETRAEQEGVSERAWSREG